jgi:hypothetical protein
MKIAILALTLPLAAAFSQVRYSVYELLHIEAIVD